jgi:hypothetical protein
LYSIASQAGPDTPYPDGLLIVYTYILAAFTSLAGLGLGGTVAAQQLKPSKRCGELWDMCKLSPLRALRKLSPLRALRELHADDTERTRKMLKPSNHLLASARPWPWAVKRAPTTWTRHTHL